MDVCIYRPLSDLCVKRYVITSTTVDLNKTVWAVLTTQHADGYRRLPITIILHSPRDGCTVTSERSDSRTQFLKQIMRLCAYEFRFSV